MAPQSRALATLAHFSMRRVLAVTVALAALPAAADARYAGGGGPTPITPFPIAGTWEWGGPDTGFGDRGGSHDGEDVMAECGTPLVAAAPGRVTLVDNDGAAGHHLVMRVAGSGEHHVYMHLAHRPRVREGDTVTAGQALGAVGRTGNASACHLHFEIWSPPGWYRGKARDPRPDLERWAS
jgi:murein DD-endopeptidase MepM/ murein hydrolase activator NlpD